jgi:hypothetical protein
MTVLVVTAVLFAGGYEPVDIREQLNVNPLSDTAMDRGGVDVPEAKYLWLEGEDAGAMSEGLGADPAYRASGGRMLGGGFGNNPGDWAEWYFDAPFQCDDAILYVRTTRAGENAFTSLTCAVNGEERGTLLVPVNAGWGDTDLDFEKGICSVPIGRIHMGRQVIRLTAGDTYEPIAVDGFWLASDVIDIVNRVGNDGKIQPVASPYMLVYPYGRRIVDRVPFELVDPEENEGRGIIRLLQGESVTLSLGHRTMTQLHVLGAGVRGSTVVTVTFAMAEGEQTASATLGALYTRPGEGGAMGAGRYRSVYRAEVACPDVEVGRCVIRADEGDIVLLGVTADLGEVDAKQDDRKP